MNPFATISSTKNQVNNSVLKKQKKSLDSGCISLCRRKYRNRIISKLNLNEEKDSVHAYVFKHEFTCQNLDQAAGVRESRLSLDCDQKRDQAKIKALEIYFRKWCRKPNARNFNLDFYSSNSVGCP